MAPLRSAAVRVMGVYGMVALGGRADISQGCFSRSLVLRFAQFNPFPAVKVRRGICRVLRAMILASAVDGSAPQTGTIAQSLTGPLYACARASR
jgi:hypothetical protein